MGAASLVDMSVGDGFLLVVRWLHLVAAAAWVGGSIFYLLIVRPAVRRSSEPPRQPPLLDSIASAEFRGLVDVCIMVLVASGVILSFERLTGSVADVPFVVTLGVKTALSLWMFYISLSLRRRRAFGPTVAQENPAFPFLTGWMTRLVTRYNLIIALGIVVFLLSDLLKVLYELALVAD